MVTYRRQYNFSETFSLRTLVSYLNFQAHRLVFRSSFHFKDVMSQVRRSSIRHSFLDHRRTIIMIFVSVFFFFAILAIGFYFAVSSTDTVFFYEQLLTFILRRVLRRYRVVLY